MESLTEDTYLRSQIPPAPNRHRYLTQHDRYEFRNPFGHHVCLSRKETTKVHSSAGDERSEQEGPIAGWLVELSSTTPGKDLG